MERDYSSILAYYGFDQIPDPEDTTLAFYHEIHNTLFDDDSPFDANASMVVQLPNTLDYMIQCSLELKAGYATPAGVHYLIDKWYASLSYSNTKFEQIQRTSTPFGEEIRILAISEATACSFLFTVVDEAARRNSDNFIDGYSPADDPDALLLKLSGKSDS